MREIWLWNRMKHCTCGLQSAFVALDVFFLGGGVETGLLSCSEVLSELRGLVSKLWRLIWALCKCVCVCLRGSRVGATWMQRLSWAAGPPRPPSNALLFLWGAAFVHIHKSVCAVEASPLKKNENNSSSLIFFSFFCSLLLPPEACGIWCETEGGGGRNMQTNKQTLDSKHGEIIWQYS